MLLELDIQDLAIIERLRCRLLPGLNVLTGETGAGKSIIVDALGLLLGQRADSAMVRAGAERAVIHGQFDPEPVADLLGDVLGAHGVPSEPELLLAREVHAEGRSTARVNGRVVPVRALAEIGRLLVDMHGQGETTSLLRGAEHIELLDRYAGFITARGALAEQVARHAAVTAELAAISRERDARRRRAEALAHAAAEIAQADLAEGEEAELQAERARLGNAERLALLADRAYAALRDPGDGREGGVDLLDRALEALQAIARIDGSLTPAVESVAAAAEALTERASEVLAYRDRLEFDPARLQEVEDRLALIGDLKRKYGPDVAAVLDHERRATRELAELEGGEERLAELRSLAAALLDEIGGRAASLSAARAKAAARLGSLVERELAELGMAGSRFVVEVTQRDHEDGVPLAGRRVAFGAHGVDSVEFLVSANPGEPPRPLVSVASGGETARIMLGLKGVLQAADRVPVLVFDEIDAGIGGRVGAVVGRRLWSLTDRHQVLCVTHLPQVAAYGDVHWRVQKQVVDGRTVTLLARIAAAERVNEIAQMLGTGSTVGRQSALLLLQETEAWKVGQRTAAGRA